MSVLKWIDQRKHWWKVFIVIFAVSISVVGYIGYQTYEFAPPIADFVDETGEVVFAAGDIVAGQQVFFRRGLMEYGSFLGDGGMRGPDYTAEALSFVARAMSRHYEQEYRSRFPDEQERRAVVAERVERELKHNRYDAGYYGEPSP